MFNNVEKLRRSRLAADKNDKDKKDAKTNHLGSGIALGVGVGLAVGSSLGNASVGLAVGIALGLAWGVTMQKKQDSENDD